MRDGLCGSCVHWRIDDDEYHRVFVATDPDTFEPMEMPFEVRQCTHPALLQFERPVERNQASVADGSDYLAVLATGPDFGCVRWEANDAKRSDEQVAAILTEVAERPEPMVSLAAALRDARKRLAELEPVVRAAVQHSRAGMRGVMLKMAVDALPESTRRLYES